MTLIHKLSTETISQIAAGEVIERPAYVVKELIENALDARASEIEIDLVDYGLSKIEITDNGLGMNKNDLTLSILPHTTSKLLNIEDLHSISTLGFRGEALASINSVSNLSIASKTVSEPTGYINNKGAVKPVGMAKGTRVIVTELFSKIPARKKFLKNNVTELRLISEVVAQYIFSNPKVNFKLSHNNRILIDETSKKIRERIEKYWGNEITSQLMPLKHSANTTMLKGVIGKPQASIGNQSKLWIFVNGRRITDNLISTAIREAFGTLLMGKSYPIGVIFLETPPELVDINVHPTKREVRFVHSNEVFNDVKEAVTQLLAKNNLTYQNVSFRNSEYSIKNDLKETVFKKDIAHLGQSHSDYVLQIHNSYLVKEVSSGFLIIDQHAAHESLLYFEFLKAWEDKKKSAKTVQLHKPLVLKLKLNDELLLEEHLDEIKKIGFSIDEFGEHTYRITKIPKLYEDQDIREVIINLLLTLSENTKGLSDKEHYMLATLACKSAIKAGMTLSLAQRIELCNALTEKHLAYTCPHGRPVKIEITMNELARMFKRK